MKKIYLFIFLIIPFFLLEGASVIWTTPSDTLSSTNQNASDPQIAMDANGNVVALWLENDVVISSAKSLNGSWLNPTNVLSNSGASSPKLVIDPNGNATAIWVENGVIKSASLPFNGSWTSASTLSGSGTASSPQVSVDTTGNVVAVWEINNVIQSSTQLFNSTWQSVPDTISDVGASSPQIAIGANGNVVAVWAEITNTGSMIYSANKLISGSWNAGQAISSSSFNSIYPIVNVDLNGNALAAWLQFAGTNIELSALTIQSAAMPMNGNWSLSRSVSGGIFNPTNPFGKILVDGSGEAFAIWSLSLDGYSFTIQTAIKYVNEEWGNPQYLSLGLYSFAADAAITSLGNAFTAYMFFDTNNNIFNIQETEYDLNSNVQGWKTPDTVSQGTNNGYPQIAASYIGNNTNVIAIAWIQVNNASYATIQAVTGVQTVIQPPAGLAVVESTQDWGIYNECYNTLSWLPSPSQDVKEYLIFRNGFFICSVDSSVLQFIDHNRVPNDPVTYGVAAVDKDRMQSSIATIAYP